MLNSACRRSLEKGVCVRACVRSCACACVLAFVDFDEACLSIPMLSSPHIFQEGRNRWYLRWLLNAVAFILESPLLYKHLQSRGLQVFFWVLNDDDDFHRVKQRKENGLQLSWTPAPTRTHPHAPTPTPTPTRVLLAYYAQ